ncbi:NADH-quinone oxidoreductase subunit NuoG [Buchnera aphidicola]|uniref:NADH-quinone oxidoreductase subunit NuoG n=1 Tax=Buchnera aphidicola TaxID=9 RepID=UPI003464958F
MVMVYINGSKYNADVSKNLLQNCLSLNINIPYFCWHPELGSVGFCRLCAVKQYNNVDDKVGRIIMSCITPIIPNMIVSTIDREAQKFQKGIIELLMTNHPHDCPICEEGGNCHLQDMTVITKQNNRRYIYPKRIHKNQYLGEFITHQMNRCIGCYRCVRYYKDYSGGDDFGVYGTSNNIYFGRFQEGAFKSVHSGNLIEVCPTGVFTDKTSYEHYNRKWDLQHSPSICQHCSLGCNIIIGEKYGKLCKIENRYHESLNRYFLCDLGRFGYGYVNVDNRIKNPIKNIHVDNTILNVQDTILLISNIIKKSNRVLGIGSIRSSIESNFALRKLVHQENFSSGLSNTDHNCLKLIVNILQNSGIYIPTLSEIEDYDVVLIIGEDITQTSPRLDLSIRQLHRNKKKDATNIRDIPNWHSMAMLNISNDDKKCIYLIYSHETSLDNITQMQYYGSIQDQEVFASSISDHINQQSHNVQNVDINFSEKVFKIVHALLSSKKPLIISGAHSGSTNLIKAATNIAKGLQNLNKNVGLLLLTPSSNSIGVSIMSNLSIEYALNEILAGTVDTLIVLENDLYRNFCSDFINKVLKKLKNLIVLDHIMTKTTKKSTMLLPVSNFFESSGTVINYEGRSQRFFSVCDPIIYSPQSSILESWQWLYKIYLNIYDQKKNIHLDDVIEEYSNEIELFRKIKFLTPNSNFRILNQKISRLPHRASGRTAILSHYNVHEPEQKKDKNTMFNFSMEGMQPSHYNLEYIPFSWFPGWNSIQSFNKYDLKKQTYNSGIRIFQTHAIDKNFFFHIMINLNNMTGEWNIVPYYVLFGNEELSQYSPVIQKQYSKVYALLNIQYKKILGLKKNSVIECDCLKNKFTFFIKFSYKLPLQQIGLPLGRLNVPRTLLGKNIRNIRGII